MMPEEKRMVLPSGRESTTSWVPINPEAPERLSTMKFCPMLFWNAFESSRAWISVPPPGGYGTTMRTDRSGHCWAWACMALASETAATAATAQASSLMSSSPRRVITSRSACRVASYLFLVHSCAPKRSYSSVGPDIRQLYHLGVLRDFALQERSQLLGAAGDGVQGLVRHERPYLRRIERLADLGIQLVHDSCRRALGIEHRVPVVGLETGID